MTLARALIGNPDVLLLDDPLRNVDAKLRYEMRLELPNLLRRGTAAVLYVTQDYREAMAIADRIAVLIDGRLAQVATPADIYAQPASVAVARLFGDPTINLAEVSPVAEHGMQSAVVTGARMRLGAADGAAPAGACWLGVRPEDLAVSSACTDDAIRHAQTTALTYMGLQAGQAIAGTAVDWVFSPTSSRSASTGKRKAGTGRSSTKALPDATLPSPVFLPQHPDTP